MLRAGEATVQALRQAGGEAMFIAADLSQEDEVRNVVERTITEFGALHVVINNAGAGRKNRVSSRRMSRGCAGTS